MTDQPANKEQSPAPADQQPATGEVQNASPAQVSHFVTSIKDVHTQVGEHVIGALQQPNTVAVVTSVVVGPGGKQHIVSAALDPQKAAMVNQLISGAKQQRKEEVQCVGYHCIIEPKEEKPDAS
ncbi:MAG: hypothetical protein Aurels2KO_52840 [Aureliella sp.]